MLDASARYMHASHKHSRDALLQLSGAGEGSGGAREGCSDSI